MGETRPLPCPSLLHVFQLAVILGYDCLKDCPELRQLPVFGFKPVFQFPRPFFVDRYGQQLVAVTGLSH